MEVLRVKIDRRTQTAEFSGATFTAKEDIKQLGAARWDRAEQVWRVTQFTESTEQLHARFPNLEVEEVGAAAVDSPAETAPLVGEPPGVPDSISVSQLNAKIRGIIASAFPDTIYVRGVLSSVKHSRGYLFMELAEEERREEVLNCVIWRNAEQILAPLKKAGFEVEVDLQVLFEVRVSFYPKRGSITLEVVGVIPEYTIAKLAALREKTNERLRAEGLFERNKQLKLPVLPVRLGILTSQGGTVIHDFRNSLDASRFGFQLYWYPVRVQGVGAKDELVRGLALLQTYPLDAILVFRGGGSAADLAVFNEYEVAKAVCTSRYPVCAAIGHQEDQSSVQDVSFLAFGVPKDIGRFFADIVIEHRREVDQLIRRLVDRTTELLRAQFDRLHNSAHRVHVLAEGALRRREELLNRHVQAMPRLAGRQLADGSSRLRSCIRPIVPLSLQRCSMDWRRTQDCFRAVLQAQRSLWQRFADKVEYLEHLVVGASPETQLKRGFAIVRRRGKEDIVTSAATVSEGEEIEVQFQDAVTAARVLEN